MTYVYKVCSKKEWNDASEVGFYSGSKVDINDGFIHLSTINQIQVTVSKHFAGQEDLLIIQFDENKIQMVYANHLSNEKYLNYFIDKNNSTFFI